MSFDHRAHRYSKGRACSTCPSPIANNNVSGRCRQCCIATFHSPEMEERRLAGIRAKMDSDPFYVARLRANMRQVGLNAAKDPEIQRGRRERGLDTYNRNLNKPEVRDKIRATRARVGKMLRERALGWCPPEHLKEYKYLVKKRDVGSVKAKEIIVARMKAEVAALSPFERQMRALERGARLVPNYVKPIFGFPSLPVDNGDNQPILSKSAIECGKEQFVNGQEELAA